MATAFSTPVASARAGAAQTCRVLQVLPPYHVADPLVTRGSPPAPRGTVLLIDVQEPRFVSRRDLGAVVEQLRRGAPAALALRLPSIHPATLPLAFDAQALGVRAVLLHDQPLRETLWSYLSDPRDIAGDWLAWIRSRHPIGERLEVPLRQVITVASSHSTLRDALLAASIPARTLRHLLQGEGLPKLEKWFTAARLLHVQLRLQREPALTLAQAAESLGYGDQFGFSTCIQRTFGVSARVARRLLGLEWRFAAWWQRTRREPGG